MKTKHTPGTWHVDNKTGHVVTAFVGDSIIVNTGERRREKDARLIAAAPELLSAANRAKKWIELYGPTDKPGYTDICMTIAELRNRVQSE